MSGCILPPVKGPQRGHANQRGRGVLVHQHRSSGVYRGLVFRGLEMREVGPENGAWSSITWRFSCPCFWSAWPRTFGYWSWGGFCWERRLVPSPASFPFTTAKCHNLRCETSRAMCPWRFTPLTSLCSSSSEPFCRGGGSCWATPWCPSSTSACYSSSSKAPFGICFVAVPKTPVKPWCSWGETRK